jgi:hypothetical protein
MKKKMMKVKSPRLRKDEGSGRLFHCQMLEFELILHTINEAASSGAFMHDNGDRQLIFGS